MWVMLSLGAMSVLAAMTLVFVKLGRDGVPSSIILFYLFVFASIINFGYLKVLKTPLQVSGNALLWILVTAILSFMGNMLVLQSFKTAPNPGYASAIEASKAAVIMLLSIWLFSSQITITKGLGVILCTIGVALISL
jgi:uncharacterized membrane protein